MKIHVSELEGRALDWAVAMASGIDIRMSDGYPWQYDSEGSRLWNPTRRWSQCGPLIESAQLDIEWYGVDGYPIGWLATCENGTGERHDGHTVQLAICRAFVAESIGSEVEIPDELVG